MSASAPVLLRAEDLWMEFYQPRLRKRVTALGGVNLEIFEGEFASIVGPSGCGKTTFLNIVDGLLSATRGRVLLRDRNITEAGSDRAMVFQDPSLLPWRTVMGNVLYGVECQGRTGPDIQRRAEQLVATVGLRGFEHHYPHELSGGMQQRVNLARALLFDPEILLMDEPFAALDAQTRELMQAELLNIWQQSRKTVLFITHQINEAIYLSDRVIVFSGRPGTVKEIVSIDLPRPRPLDVKRTPKFLEYEDHLWRLIEGEARRSAEQDQALTLAGH